MQRFTKETNELRDVIVELRDLPAVAGGFRLLPEGVVNMRMSFSILWFPFMRRSASNDGNGNPNGMQIECLMGTGLPQRGYIPVLGTAPAECTPGLTEYL